VFTHPHPRTTARDTGPGRRVAAALTTLTLGTAFALAGAGTAQAAGPDYVSWAEARFLSGSVLGVDLDGVVSVQPALAWNDGNDPTMTDKDPLKVKVLDAVTVGNGDSVQLSATDGIQSGVVGQFAVATASGVSRAATGALLDDGGIGVGQDVRMPGADATVHLSQVLGDSFADTLTNLDLSITAIGAQARADGASATGEYTIEGAQLKLSSPAISQLTEKVNAALDEVQGRIGLLDGSDGALAAALNKALRAIDPALNLLGGDGDVTASIDTGNLRKVVQDLLAAQYADSGVTFDLETGIVTIDLAAAMGGNLNDLPPGTELLSSPVITQVLSSITTKVAGIADAVVARITEVLHDAVVNLSANVSVDVAQAPLVQKVCTTVKKVVQVPTDVVKKVTIQVPVVDGVIAQIVNGVPVINGIPIVGNLIGGTLGGILGGTKHTVTWITQTVEKTVTELVDKTVDQLVCENKVTKVAPLQTSAAVNLTGTVDDFVNGADVDASAKVKVLGVTVPALNLPKLTSSLGTVLGGSLFQDDGAISRLTTALDTGLVQPAVNGLLDGDNAVGVALTDVLSIKANVQGLSDGRFTQTALRVSALGGSGAVVNLAQASVGPNVTSVQDPCVVDCGVGGETTTPPGGAGGVLAMTGVSIAMLIALVLALLAAGAYLVRESYRHKHPSIPAE
jgi:hypothetical protein